MDDPILIGDWEKRDANREILGGRYTERTYKLREWGNFNPGYDLKRIFRYLLYHDYPEETGSQKIVLYLRNDLAVGGVGEVKKTPGGPSDLQIGNKSKKPIRVIGGLGSEPGRFNQPRDLEVDGQGRVVVMDTLNGRVQRFDPNGKPDLQFGSSGEGDGQFSSATGLALDGDGNIYVADTWNHRIQKFDSRGKFLLKWGSFGSRDYQFYGPRDVEIGPNNEVFVSDTGNRRILVYDREGKFLRSFGKEGSRNGEFVEQVGLALDPRGNLYVADTGNRRVQVFDLNGKFLRTFTVIGWEEYFTEPYLDVRDPWILLSDSKHNRIGLYSLEGKFAENWGGKGTGEGEFLNPIGVAFGTGGEVLVADTFNNRLQEFPRPEAVVLK
jgi:DNA-binding beta-propeller fold protein YncE